MAGVDAAHNGQDQGPAVIQDLAGSVENVLNGVQLLLADVGIGDAAELGQG